jgi:hypothetical protein
VDDARLLWDKSTSRKLFIPLAISPKDGRLLLERWSSDNFDKRNRLSGSEDKKFPSQCRTFNFVTVLKIVGGREESLLYRKSKSSRLTNFSKALAGMVVS